VFQDGVAFGWERVPAVRLTSHLFDKTIEASMTSASGFNGNYSHRRDVAKSSMTAHLPAARRPSTTLSSVRCLTVRDFSEPKS
jgi:hypothetical protein